MLDALRRHSVEDYGPIQPEHTRAHPKATISHSVSTPEGDDITQREQTREQRSRLNQLPKDAKLIFRGLESNASALRFQPNLDCICGLRLLTANLIWHCGSTNMKSYAVRYNICAVLNIFSAQQTDTKEYNLLLWLDHGPARWSGTVNEHCTAV